MKWTVLVTLLLFLAGGVAFGGYLLPATRQGAAERLIDAPPDLVRQTLLDVESQPAWRADVAEVRRSDDGWTETTRAGEVIAFRLVQDDSNGIALRFESTRGYSGTWQARLEPAPDGSTRISVQEQVTTPAPFGRLLSRLFFNPQDFATRYLEELSAEVARRTKALS